MRAILAGIATSALVAPALIARRAPAVPRALPDGVAGDGGGRAPREGRLVGVARLLCS